MPRALSLSPCHSINILLNFEINALNICANTRARTSFKNLIYIERLNAATLKELMEEIPHKVIYSTYT